MGGTLPSTIDNKNLVFSLTGSDATPVSGRSQLTSATTTNSGSSNDAVDVQATQINVTQQPTTSVNAYIALPTQPIFEATDAKGNRDLDINSPITVNTSPDLGLASPLANFSSGVADFTGSGLNFHNTGTSPMTVSISSPSSITSTPTNAITVTASTALGSSAVGMSPTPLINSTVGLISGGSATNAVLGFSLQTTGSPLTLTDITFTSSPSSVGLVKNFKLYSNTTDSFTGATLVTSSTTLTFGSVNVPIGSAIKYFYLTCDVEDYFPTATSTIQFSIATSGLTISTGNKTGGTLTGINYSLVDNTAPVIQSILTMPSYENPWGTLYSLTTPAYNGNQADFLMTFSEPVQNMTPSKLTTSVYSGNPPNYPGASYTLSTVTPTDNVGNAATTPSQYWRISYTNLAGSGYLYNNYTNNPLPKVIDVAGNIEATSGSFVGSGKFYYYLVLPKPTNSVSSLNLNGGPTTTSISLSWIQPAVGSQAATHYLIRGKESALSFSALNNGVRIADDADASDGFISVNIANSGYPGSSPLFLTNTFSNLKSGKSYDFEIYPYTISPNVTATQAIEYNLTPATLTSSTTTVASAQLLNVVAVSSISSLTTTQVLSEAQTTPNLQFDLRDELTDLDNAPTKFSDIIVFQGAGNAPGLSDWTQAIAGAILTDGTTKVTGTVSANQISFTGFSHSTNGDFGFVPDGSTPKTYSLYVWLKTSLGGSLPSTIDNLHFSFLVNNGSFTMDNASSNQASTALQSGQSALSGAGANQVSVVASQLVIATQPTTPIGVATNFPTAPIINALDANGNLDLGYSNVSNITNTGGLTQSLTSQNFSAGVLALNSFNFTSAGGPTQIQVTGTGVPAVGSVNSTNVTTVISNLTSISAGAVVEPASFSSLTTSLSGAAAPQLNAVQNFDFDVTDDFGANTTTYDNNDGLPTLITALTITQNSNNGTNGGGDPLFDDWTNSIAGAELSDGATSITASSITATTIVFTSIPITLNKLGYVPDGTTKKYRLKIWLKNPVNSGLSDIIDNKDFVFDIAQSGITITGVANTSSTMQTSNTNSGDTNNKVNVTATKLDFITQWANNANQNYDAALSPTPTAKAHDVNGNLDTDYNTAVTVATTVPATYPVANSTVTNTNGMITFNSGLKVTSAGGGLNGATTNLVLTSGSLTGQSNPFILNYSGVSDVVRNTGFSYPTDIDYASVSNQTTDITGTTGIEIEEYTVRDGGGSSDADGTPTVVGSVTFTVQNIYLLRKLALYNNLGNEVAEIDVQASKIGNNVTFSGLPVSGVNAIIAPDNTTIDFTVKASFLSSNIADNDVVNLNVTAIASASVSSAFTAGASTTMPTLAANENAIEVTATQLNFTHPTLTEASASINVPYTAIYIRAEDAFNNLDVDYTGSSNTVTTFTNNGLPTVTMTNGPVNGTTQFTNGIIDFAASFPNFEFTTGNNGETFTMSMTSAGSLSGTSNTVTLKVSAESSLQLDPSFKNTISPNLPWVQHINYLDSATFGSSTNGYELMRTLLVDGSRTNYNYHNAGTLYGNYLNAVTDDDANGDGDLDGAPSVLSGLSVRIYGASSLNTIALYDSTGTIIPSTLINVRSLNLVRSPVGGVDTVSTVFNWSGTLLTAKDDGQAPMSIRVTFRKDVNIRDQDTLRIKLLSATAGNGSQFYKNSTSGYIGGENHIPNPAQSIAKVDVVATSLDFTTQPSQYAGTSEPVGINPATSQPYSYGNPATLTSMPSTGSAIVKARDIYKNLDLDFTYPATSITITDVNETIASPAGFIKGILDLNGLVYTKAGTGTLKVKAGTLDSSVPPAGNIGNSIPGQLVNVINVKATLQTNGVLTTQNLKGGSTNLVIFGVTLSPESQTATEPVLKKLIISFDNPFQLTIGGNTTNILKNFKVKESISASPSSAQDVVATLGGTITYAASPALLASEAPGQPRAGQIDYDMLVIDLSSSPRPFRDPNNNSATSLTYYLFADVDVTANISTPSLTPMVTDLGYLNADDANILLSEGTARSDSSGQVRPVRGISFRFASTRPPQLLASQCSPFNGQLNVDPAIDSIKLSFDVSVWSLDGKAKLYKRVVNGTNVQVADLIAANGEYYKFLDGSLSTPPMAASPINFYISFLDSVPGKKYKFQYDTVYYVNITKGSLNGNVGSGISDNGFNYYGGISSSSTYYFKISSNVPPTLSLAKTIFSNSTTVAFQTTYDQLGTAFYLVLNSGSPVPTVADIIDPTTYKIIHPGTYIYNGKDTIKQVNSAQTTTFFTPTPLSTSSTYDVWVFAQNDAQPVPKKAAGPYLFNSLSNTFTTSPLLGTGPTFKIPTSTGVNIYSPSYTLCPNSFINLTDPIIIGEANVGDFSSPSAQDFYLYLPTGYQFDGTTKPDVLLNGTDFTDNTPKIDFINRTLIHVSNYTNQGSASIDNIIISNLRVIGAAGSGSGKVTVFAGTNKLSSVLPTLITTSSAPVANISLFSFTPPDFVNSYSTENKFPNPPFGSTDISTLPPSPFPSTSSVTYIPNNYIDKDQALAQSGSIRLLPVITSPNDYNASFFTGSGVTNDQLTLSAVALNAAFDITMTHTDPNGCASSVSNQYLVYDHTRPVSKKLGSAYSGTALEGTAQAIINTNFGVGSAASIPSQILNLDDLTGYKLINLRANIPAGVVNHQVSQIMSDSLPNGPWQKLIAKIPVAHDSTATSANPTGFYRGYQWDYAHILNAVAESGNSISIDPYDNFKVIGRTQAGNDFWTGGSLGKVEFTGSFQSQADFTVIVPFRQEVELFVPAVPVIEVASANQSSYDALDQVTNATDGMTPKQHFNESQFTGFTLRKGVITTDINSASVVGIGTFFTTDLKVGATIKDISKNKIGVVQSITDDTHLVLTGNSTQSVTNGSYTASGYQGTPVFCEAGGSIILNAYPAASANASGIFSVYDFKSYNFAGFVTRTGTISTQSGSTQVVGTGTLFTTELTVGSVVSDGSGVVIGTVGTITDNLHLTLKTSAPSTIADGIFRANLNVPLATSSTSSGFIDNGNGSMTLNSALIKNGYNDILVSYSYRDNNSPAVGTAYMVLRVTPNPVAQFTVASIPAIAGSPGASAFDAFCVNNQIKFNADSAAAYMQKNQQASQAGTTPNTISNYVWDFGDPNSGLPNSPATPNAIPNSPALPGGEGGTIINTAYQQPGTSTTQTYNAPFHIYATSSSYNVALTLTSNWGCTSLQSNAVISLQQASVGFMGSAGAIAVGDIPSVKFDFAGNCVSDPIKFSDKGSSLLNTNGGQVAVSNWDWNFGDSGVGTGKNTTHVYTNSGFFGVTLTETTNIGKLVDVTSTSGCKATATKNLAQLPLQKPTATASYFEYFGAGNGGWLPLDATGGSGSWVWGSTSGKLNSVFNTGSADSLWVTKLSGTYNPNEQSSLYSVCLDLTNLPRPMLSFNGFVNLLQGDGLVAEYSYDTLNISDPNKSWVRLGSYDNTTKLSDGLEWYNASGLPSVPGGSASNASGQGWAGDSVKWIHPKHELDEVKSATAAYAAARGVAARSILRFALSTLGNSSNTQADGVGIDSVRIGSRTRTIMFENFTTTDGGNSNLNATLKTEADSIISFNARTVGTQLVNINYHIGFLGKDPFNMDNPADPSARALYYHIQKVPYAFLDGVHSPQFGNGSDLFKDWGQRAYNLQTLELAKANFADSLNNNPITTVTSYPLDSVGIDVHFTPVITLPKGTVLHVAVVEENVQKSQLPSADVIGTTEDQFEFVLKKMLPDAAGTKFTTALSQNVPVHRKFTWRPDRGKIYSNSVAVVLFLQNDSTKEIYQAEMFGNITPPGVITEVALTPENVTIYPNPSDREFVIELPEPTTQRLSIRLANQLGQYTEAGEFAEGEQKKTVSTQGLADGMYIVTVGNGKHAIRSKVIVVHK
ncbi:MAG: T9SS type A sorting domain-containing protein [Bacteroidetes bacterium]|nr:T9SS type A sorting domain-containing protein [Bacteroidota bacterium]